MPRKPAPAPEFVQWRKLFAGNLFRIHNAYEASCGRRVRWTEVAAALQVDPSLVSQYLGAKTAPDVPGLIRLSRFYQVDVAEFFGTEASRRQLLLMEQAASDVAASLPSPKKKGG